MPNANWDRFNIVMLEDYMGHKISKFEWCQFLIKKPWFVLVIPKQDINIATAKFFLYFYTCFQVRRKYIAFEFWGKNSVKILLYFGNFIGKKQCSIEFHKNQDFNLYMEIFSFGLSLVATWYFTCFDCQDILICAIVKNLSFIWWFKFILNGWMLLVLHNFELIKEAGADHNSNNCLSVERCLYLFKSVNNGWGLSRWGFFCRPTSLETPHRVNTCFLLLTELCVRSVGRNGKTAAKTMKGLI